MDVYWCIVDGNFYDMHYVVDEGSQIIGIPSLCRFMGLIDSMTVKFYRDAGVGPEWPRGFCSVAIGRVTEPARRHLGPSLPTQQKDRAMFLIDFGTSSII